MSDRVFEIKEEDLQTIMNTLVELPYKHAVKPIEALKTAQVVDKAEPPADSDGEAE